MEKIIYSPSLNETMYLKSSSLNHDNHFLLRVMNFHDLVTDANIRLGLVNGNEMITRRALEIDASNIINKLEGMDINSFKDVEQFISSLDEIRKSLLSEDEVGEYKAKLDNEYSLNENYQKLCAYFEAYMNFLNESELEDDISLAKKLLNKGEVYDEITYLKEDNLSILELELLEDLSKEVKEISYEDLYTLKEKTNNISVTAYYGNLSEVDGVIEDILKNGYKFSDVLIVLPSKSEYPTLFYEKYLLDKIPFTFGCGINISSTPVFKLFKELKNLEEAHFFSALGFKSLFRSGYFDTSKIVNDESLIDNLSEVLGRLKIGYGDLAARSLMRLKELIDTKKEDLTSFIKMIDKQIDVDEMLLLATNVIAIFVQGISFILENYLKDNLTDEVSIAMNNEAKLFINEMFLRASEINKLTIRRTFLELVQDKFVYQKQFNDQAIHVTTLNKAVSCVRKHVYFVGFDASTFPGKAKENYLFNDKQIEILTGIPNNSELLIKQKNILLRELIELYNSLGSDIHLSYSAMNIDEVEGNNPASILFDYDIKCGGNLKEKINEARYFKNEYSSLNKAVDDYFKSNKMNDEYYNEFNGYSNKNLLYKSFSPSALSSFFECPLRFYLEKCVYLRKEEEENLFTNIEANTFGNLVHLSFEYLINHHDIPKPIFVGYAEELFDTYNKFSPSIIDNSDVKTRFLESISNGYDFLKEFDLSFAYSEYSISRDDALSIEGIKFNGSVDLLTKDKDGNYVIIDYKTGKKVKHDKDDTVSVLQGLVYAILVEKKLSIKVNRIIFYYTQINEAVEVDLSLHEEELIKKINEFKDTLKLNKFEPTPSRDACMYCPFFGDLCKGEE